jgi:hypothetical protein
VGALKLHIRLRSRSNPSRKLKFGDNGLNIYNKEVLAEWTKGELRTVWPKEVQTIEPLL